MTIIRTALALSLAAGAALVAQTAAPRPMDARAFSAKMDAFVRSAMSELNVVPGVSVAVVRGADTIYKGGFGFADVAARTPVTPDTVFYTASLAKSVTGLTAATLIAEGRLSVDTPLTQLLPGLVLPPGADPKKATFGGLLGHDPGFGSPTVNYVTTFVRPYDMPELVRAFNSYSQPLPQFTYANSNYMVAGMIIGSVTGRPWKDAIADRVFVPLGMTRSTFYMSRASSPASAYRADPDGFTLVHIPKTDRTTTGAGGFFSTAPDLAQLVKAYLNHGRLGTRQAVPAAAIELAQQPRSQTSSTFGYFKRLAYGIGLYLGSYDDEPLVHHFGGITGYRAHMSFTPTRGVGVAVLQNEGGDGSNFADLVAAYAYDLLAGKDADGRAATRIAAYRTDLDKSRANPPAWIATLKTFSASPAPMPLPLDAYAGTYHSDRLGDIVVSILNGNLLVAFGEMHGTAVRIGDNKVLVDYGGGDAPDAWTFAIGDGRVSGLDWSGRPFARVR